MKTGVKFSFFLVLMVIGCSVVQLANAQNIGNWTLNNTLGGTGTPFNLANNISLGPGVGFGAFNGGNEYYGENGWPAAGINSNSYVQFSLTPVMSYMMNLNTITLRMRRSNTGSPVGSGPTRWAVRSSADGYTSDLATGTLSHNYANYVVNLPAYVLITTTITFRIYGYSSSVSSGGNSRLVIDNISVQGGTGTLPVTFSSLQARKVVAGVELTWKATNIEAGSSMAIEKSTDGLHFTIIHRQSENENRLSAEYRFIDPHANSARQYYRISSTHASGAIVKTAVVMVRSPLANELAIERVAVSAGSLTAAMEAPEGGNYVISVKSITGGALHYVQVILGEGTNRITLPMNSAARGVYVLTVARGNKVSSRQFRY